VQRVTGKAVFCGAGIRLDTRSWSHFMFVLVRAVCYFTAVEGIRRGRLGK
jgi:hypothetical protein